MGGLSRSPFTQQGNEVDMTQMKCAHPACGCGIITSQEYCSERCRTSATQTHSQRGGCHCGHPGCRSQPDA